ncbi:MAG: replicative DNA helicase, partial [Chryseobacterium sp.]
DVIIERLQVYDQPADKGLTGVATGFREMDRITSGWQKQDLIILAARPAMGKTAMALNLVRNAAVIQNIACAVFSLEMSKEQLVDRLISAETDIYFSKFKTRDFNQVDWKMIHDNIHKLVDSKILIDDSSSLSIQAFRSKAIRLKAKYDIQFIVVDYLQLMTDKTKGSNREQEISSISRGLKGVAKDLNLPILALSQLSRAVASRPGLQGKKPLLSDLRESGSIEQDADQVWFLYRPEYYGITEDEMGRSLIGLSEAIFAKNRQGPLDTAPLRFNGARMKFSDIEEEQPTFTLPIPVNYSEPQTEHQEFTIMPSKYFNQDGDPPF